MTGACALILTNNKKMIKVSKATIGKIVDVNSKNIKSYQITKRINKRFYKICIFHKCISRKQQDTK
mgnify:CR=1 FL=1